MCGEKAEHGREVSHSFWRRTSGRQIVREIVQRPLH